MPCAQAARLCPEAIFLRPNFALYKSVSQQIRAIFRATTSLVEPLSLDEAYLDVTQNLLGEPLAGKIALHIMSRIRDELGLTASAGVGPNKFVAKVASDVRKPNGCTIIPPAKVLDFIANLPIEKMWSVGPSTAKKLHAMGIRTGQDLRAQPLPSLIRTFGKQGAFLHGLARGHDPRRVEPNRTPKSRAAETTFSNDVVAVQDLISVLETLASRVEGSLQKIDRQGRTVTVKVRFSDFTTFTRSRTVSQPIRAQEDIFKLACVLLHEQEDIGSRPVRLLGISVGNLFDKSEAVQLSLKLSEQE